MRRLLASVAWSAALLIPVAVVRAAEDPLAKARLLYNQRQFQAAISAADQARSLPGRADAADLVAARAYLERYRASEMSDDLTNARDRLRRINPQRFSPGEREEYIVGLGESLFFDAAFGAAADVFDSVIRSGGLVTGDVRERVLDWWASAIDRGAKQRPDIERQPLYQTIRSRMGDELATRPGSAAAAYWLANAARLQGDVQSAWEAAQAGWVRAPLAADHGAASRADLDRLVLEAIVPDRANALAQPPDALRLQWEQFKEKWNK